MQELTTPGPEKKPVGYWLLIVTAMVFFMIILGGLTRLTHSGLSMVEWQVLNPLPPMSEAEWVESFEKYKQFPEYRKVNTDMDLEGYKGIFWLEFIHRNWGRTIGFVFFLPLVWFAVRKKIDRPLTMKLGGLFLLGAAQGGMGWYMVASGLVDRPDVSQYRLTAHLGFAVVIIGLLLWMALSQLRPRYATETPERAARLNKAVKGLLALVFVTILSGGFVAGLDAGLTYNTFPLMDGQLIPDGVFPGLAAPFEDVTTVQFDHRVLAVTTFTLILVAWAALRDHAPTPAAKAALTAMAIMAVIQLTLGVSTLLLVVPVSLASAHQGGAVVLFLLTVWTAFETRAAKPVV